MFERRRRWRACATACVILAGVFAGATGSSNSPFPASPASVASAQEPTPAPVVPIVAPIATPDPISKAKAVLVAPKTFRIGGNTTLDASGSFGDRIEWRITDSRFLMVGDGRRQAITFTDPDDENAGRPFAVTLLVFTETKDGVVTSVDSDTEIVTPAGPPAPPIVVAPPVVPVDPTKPVTPPPVDPTTKATAATYVYLKDPRGSANVPAAVMGTLNRLNREKKIIATLFEQDTTDGTDDVPEQYKIPLAEAKKAGLPCLVVTAGSTVLKVVKQPTTEAQVWEAVP